MDFDIEAKLKELKRTCNNFINLYNARLALKDETKRTNGVYAVVYKEISKDTAVELKQKINLLMDEIVLNTSESNKLYKDDNNF